MSTEQSAGSSILPRLRLPVVAAPMLLASGPELVIAAVQQGVAAGFPTANCRDPGELHDWLDQIREATRGAPGAYLPNLIVHPSNPRLEEHLAAIIEHRPEVVIASVGSPAAVVPVLHDAGIDVWCDVASVRHVDKAVAAGVDGLVLLTAGAGGQTGSANPFAFARAARRRFDGPIGLAGGIADGWSLLAALASGCDFAYMGTRFLAAREARVSTDYHEMIVRSELDDIQLTSAVTGLPSNMIRESMVAAGLDPSAASTTEFSVERMDERPRGWRDIWSAGHSVSTVDSVESVADIVRALEDEFVAARQRMSDLPGNPS